MLIIVRMKKKAQKNINFKFNAVDDIFFFTMAARRDSGVCEGG